MFVLRLFHPKHFLWRRSTYIINTTKAFCGEKRPLHSTARQITQQYCRCCDRLSDQNMAELCIHELHNLKADTHYPYVWPVHTGHLYGPYVRVSKNARPVHIGRMYGYIFRHRTYGRYIRVSKNAPVRTGRKDGPYVRAIRCLLYTSPSPRDS